MQCLSADGVRAPITERSWAVYGNVPLYQYVSAMTMTFGFVGQVTRRCLTRDATVRDCPQSQVSIKLLPQLLHLEELKHNELSVENQCGKDALSM